MCLSVREGKEGDGSDIILWSCAGYASRFKIEGGSIKYLADPKYEMAVRAARIMDGSQVILWTGYASPFAWEIGHEPGHQQIKLKADPRYCMSVREGKMGDGSNIIMWTCGANDEMQWTISGDHIVIGDYCLSVRAGEYKDGQDIILWTCQDDDHAQKWVVMGDRIRLKEHKDYCLTIRDGTAGDGSDLIVWSCDQKLQLDDEL